MSQILTVDQVAQRLGLTPKTIRQYISEGRLKAEKIGKQWRIPEHNLDRLISIGAQDQEVFSSIPHDCADKIQVSSVVDIQVSGAEESQRICNSLIAVLNSKDSSWGRASMKSSFNGSTLKLILWGRPKFIAILLDMLSPYEEGDHGKDIL